MEFVELIKTPKLDGVFLHDHQNSTVEGRLCITGHHLLLSARQENSQELWLMHKNIDSVEKKPFILQNAVVGGLITLKCKDLRIISLKIKSAKEYFNVAASLEALSTLNNPELEYPFFYRPMYTILEDGYTIFRPELEFSKLISASACNNVCSVSTSSGNSNTLTFNNTSPLSSTFHFSNGHDVTATTVSTETTMGCEWRITHINKDFKLCPTYGSVLIVPKIITDEQIVQSAAFRDGGRFPVLSYRHENGAALLRSAQPLSIQGIKRCRADEAILNVVLGRSRKGFIVDTWGKGKSNTETDQHYSQWKKVNRSIGNVSSPAAILDSFSKLIEACNDITCSPDKWLSRLESSNWLSLVLNSLNAACVVAQCLDQEGSPVLVHGAKGLDSTLIVTSLVQIILNPDCRTVRGIQALIEREWIQAGHPFASRHRHSCYTPSQNRQKSSGATFVLFLDCIHQLYRQFPCSFEFSTQLLILFFEHSYFSQYGTFLCDSERERHDLRVHTRTTSLWSYLNRPEVLKNFLNPLYEPNPSVIWPSVAPISLELWTELYLRWIVDQKNNENSNIQIQELVTNEKELRTKALKLRKQATELANEVITIIKSIN
ncbi:myotubularin-related protein 9 [Lucilia cuprina]|uniref:myotubularin-related protein 9 n=1 Tax=Lucilia cuprina TaxID=7375 RepID=UPI000C71B3B2|nr:myotubularin-related protein 9 [Lucilia cuprina]XP_046807440.1 myotubularin-related protein 9 [Lucilia cuprina]XP_046807441.1 myotubularin-related protein 9 [Lucilia cuprina]XP_046807442.1 myotubularin-related protein 9 [Lucilia cuprina]XP_046807443.1 myotubularin-related protein 9 [Lucilia cuprina]